MAAKSLPTTSSSSATLRADWIPALGLAGGIVAARWGWLEPQWGLNIYLGFGVTSLFVAFMNLIRWIRTGTEKGFRFPHAFALMTATVFSVSAVTHREDRSSTREPASAAILHLEVPQEDAFTWAQYAALEQNWILTRSDREDSSLQAYRVTPVFGFREDFTIEIDRKRGGYGGSTVSVRGHNRSEIRQYLDKLARRTPE